MISSSRQLKDKVRNISDGNSNKASTLIRNFMIERFLFLHITKKHCLLRKCRQL